MKEKILAQLKLACGETTSISDRTLENLATTLSANVTEESQIAAAIETYKPFLKELDGNINFVAAEAVKKVKPANDQNQQQNQQNQNQQNQQQNPNDQEPAWFKKYREDNAVKFAEIEASQAAIKKKEQTDALVADALKSFYKKYKITDSEKPLIQKALALELKLNPDHENSESLEKALKTQYEDFRLAAGLGAVEPVSANDGGNGKNKKNPVIDAVKKQLQAAGKLPVPETQN